MGNEELEDLIEELNKAIQLLGDVDLYSYAIKSVRARNQMNVIKCYDLLYRVRKYLKYIKKKLEKDSLDE
jgi:hypothetical protein